MFDSSGNKMFRKSLFLLKKIRSDKFNLSGQNSPKWLNRSKEAISFFNSLEFEKRQKIRIADLGCGDMKIRDMLLSGGYDNISYKGFDCLPQNEAVSNIDFNKNEIESRYDVIFCLGLLEYLDDPYNFLRKIKNKTSYVIFSYVVSDRGNYSEKEKKIKGWKNHFSSNEIEKMITKLEFKTKKTTIFDKGLTKLYLIKT